MIKIGIVGVPGAGKTSLARGLTSMCRTIPELKKVELISEYARRYISKHGSIDEIWEQYRIMEKQIEWEDSIPQKSTDILITDSPVHLGFLYTTEYVNNDPKVIMVYNDIFKKLSKLNEYNPRYDIIFHLPPKLTPVDDGVRSKIQFDDNWRKESDIKIQLLFRMLFKPVHFITVDAVDMDKRIEFCLKIMKDKLLTMNITGDDDDDFLNKLKSS